MLKVIFFDGVCGLCNGFIDFIIKVDHKSLFKFSPLQSEYAQKNLPLEYTRELSSVVVQIDGQNFRKSHAVMMVFRELGGPWRALSWLGFLPEGMLNTFYDLTASNRYKMFGKKDSCRLPSLEERTRFLL